MQELHQKKMNNKEICKLLDLHIVDFFDNLYMPEYYLKESDWDIDKMMDENVDAIFFDKKYLSKVDYPYFDKIYEKYLTLIYDIFSQDNKMYIFLKKWTIMNDEKWKYDKSNKYLRCLFNDQKYHYISPSYITKIYINNCNIYQDDIDKIKYEINKELDMIINKMIQKIEIFEIEYYKIINMYVYGKNLEINDKIYTMGFINSIILAILDFYNEMIDLNIYAIRPIISRIIDCYTPLDEIRNHNPTYYQGKKIRIV